VEAPKAEGTAVELNGDWTVSVCRSKEYPAFGEAVTVNAAEGFKGYQSIDPNFSGFVAYETQVELTGAKSLLLENVYDCVEVFVNGKSLGIQYCPPFLYDLSGVAVDGLNTIRIEVATTLEREVAAMPNNNSGLMAAFMRGSAIQAPTGLVGKVIAYC